MIGKGGPGVFSGREEDENGREGRRKERERTERKRRRREGRREGKREERREGGTDDRERIVRDLLGPKLNMAL